MANEKYFPANIIKRIFCFVIVSCLPAVQALAQFQTAGFTKTPAFGVHLAYFDFNGADNMADFGRRTVFPFNFITCINFSTIYQLAAQR